MRKFLSLVLAVIMVASMTVIAVSAADADAAAVAAEKATVTLYDIKGGSVTQTYSVGETFTATTYLNLAEINEGRVGSLKAQQEYSSDILTLADAYNTDETSYSYGAISDLKGMFPIISAGTTANGSKIGFIHFNASTAASDGFQFNADDSILIVAHYTVAAAGEATIKTGFTTLAESDYMLTRIVDKGTVVQDNFTSSAALSEPAAEEGVTVSGTVTSFNTTENSATHEVTVELVQGDETVFTVSGTGNAFAYSFADVPAGDYVLRVSKKNHVTRDYDVTVGSEDVAQDAKICPIGDVSNDGVVTNMDFARANSHARGVLSITDPYSFKCADVYRGDGEITNMDAGRINSHVRGILPLWTD